MQDDLQGASPEFLPLSNSGFEPAFAGYDDSALDFQIQPPDGLASPTAMSLSLQLADSPADQDMLLDDATRDISAIVRQQDFSAGAPDRHPQQDEELDTRQLYLQEAHDAELEEEMQHAHLHTGASFA